MTSSCEKVAFPIPDDTESNFVVSWTENKPPTPLDGFGPDIVRRTLQIPQKNGDVYEITLAIYEVTNPEKNGLSLNCSGPTSFSVTGEMIIHTKNQTKKPNQDFFKIDCRQMNKNGPPKSFENHYTIPKFLTPTQFPITINIKLGINQIEPRPNSTFLRLAHLIEDLCFNDEMSDCRIICEDQIFPCHKFILSVRSDVFKTMFQTMDMQEGKDGDVKVDDISAKTMKLLLIFIYKDILAKEDIDPDLLIAAEKYNIKRLFDIVSKHLLSELNADNVMETLVTAYLVNHDPLLKAASDFIFENRPIKKDSYWDKIKTTYPEIATKILDLVVFNVKEEDLKKD